MQTKRTRPSLAPKRKRAAVARALRNLAERLLHTGVELHDVRRPEVEIDGLQLRADWCVWIEGRQDIRKRRTDDRCACREWRIQAA